MRIETQQCLVYLQHPCVETHARSQLLQEGHALGVLGLEEGEGVRRRKENGWVVSRDMFVIDFVFE